MQIAVLSGKGGTGKTFVSVNLASAIKNSQYIDCDVEEPNGHLFFNPVIDEKLDVHVTIPTFIENNCNLCRKCVDFCKYNALAIIKDKIHLFKEICHSCGGCYVLCPEEAVLEIERPVGFIQKGYSDQVEVISGFLNTGEVSGVPIIKKLLSNVKKDSNTIIDCPPGSACVVMESIRNADYCILVAEPTLFGLHNMKMVFELVKLFKKPVGIVINKFFEPNNLIEEFCKNNDVKILSRIPYTNDLFTINSSGKIAVKENESYSNLFKNIFDNIKTEVCL